MKIKCEGCGILIEKNSYQRKYCGSNNLKTGCSYEVALEKIRLFRKQILYGNWSAMRKRCIYRKHPAYARYGGKGITICDRWSSFENFKKDMLKSYNKHVLLYGKNDTSLDRIDNSKGYLKENCRWATAKIQNNNTRLNAHLKPKANIKCLICKKIFYPPKRNSKYCSRACSGKSKSVKIN